MVGNHHSQGTPVKCGSLRRARAAYSARRETPVSPDGPRPSTALRFGKGYSERVEGDGAPKRSASSCNLERRLTGTGPETRVDARRLVAYGNMERKGWGLFAGFQIPEGAVVAAITAPVGRKEASQWCDHRDNMRLPHDAAIHVAGKRLLIYDQSWTDTNNPPRWYLINHASARHANVRMIVVGPPELPRKQRVYWITTKHVPRFTELAYTYTDPNPEWSSNVSSLPPHQLSGYDSRISVDEPYVPAMAAWRAAVLLH